MTRCSTSLDHDWLPITGEPTYECVTGYRTGTLREVRMEHESHDFLTRISLLAHICDSDFRTAAFKSNSTISEVHDE